MSIAYTVVVFLALTVAIVFVSMYSRFRWEDTPEGVNAMAFGVFLALLASSRVVQVVWELAAIADIVSVIAWVCLTLLLVHRILIIRSLHRERSVDENKKRKVQ